MTTKLFLQRTIRWMIAWVVYYSRFLKLWRRVCGDSTSLILVYHRVVDETNIKTAFSVPGIIVNLRSFRKQIDYLSKHREIVSLEEFVGMVKDGARLEDLIVITFDDGWRDNYTHAYPVLRKCGVPATIFLVTDYIGTNHWFWPEKIVYILSRRKSEMLRIPEAMRKSLGPDFTHLPMPSDITGIHTLVERVKHLSSAERESVIRQLSKEAKVPLSDLEKSEILLGWDEVQEMANNGISFGSHTQTHLIMTQVPIDRASEETCNSKLEIEKRLKRPCTSFAYPNGDWNEDVRDLLVEADYECACSLSTTLSKTNVDLYSLKRINIHEGVSSGVNGKFSECLFAVEISGFLDRVIRRKRT